MAFNIWERWPWTSFQNLNLDWLMKAVKEAVTKAKQASDSVGQFDDRITANENDIDQLEDDIDTISSPLRVYVIFVAFCTALCLQKLQSCFV